VKYERNFTIVTVERGLQIQMIAVRARLLARREIFFAGTPSGRRNEHVERIRAARGERAARPDTRKHRAPVLRAVFVHF
jgi:hypothetical protein